MVLTKISDDGKISLPKELGKPGDTIKLVKSGNMFFLYTPPASKKESLDDICTEEIPSEFSQLSEKQKMDIALEEIQQSRFEKKG